jgi:hypothetical protein
VIRRLKHIDLTQEEQMFKKKMMEEMTWKEVDELRKKDAVVLLPAGSVEVEGTH